MLIASFYNSVKMKNFKKEILAYFGMALCTLIIGLSFIFVKIALRTADTVDILAHRFSMAVIGMLLVYLSGKQKFPRLTVKQILPLLGISIAYPLLFFLFQTEGLKYTTALDAGILSAMMPILTMVFAAILLKEKNTPIQVFSIILSTGGIMYILMKSGANVGSSNLKGNILILLSVLSIVMYYVFGRKVNKKYNSLDITFFMTIVACVVFNLVAIVKHIQTGTMHTFFEPLTESSFLWSVIYLGVLSSFLSSFLSNYALSAIPASQVAIFNNITPIITVFGGVMFLNEALRGYHIIGGMLVLLGIVGTLAFKKK